ACRRAGIKYQVLHVLASPCLLALTWLVGVAANVIPFCVAFATLHSIPAALLITFISCGVTAAAIVIGKAGLNPSTEDVAWAQQFWQGSLRTIQSLEAHLADLRNRLAVCETEHKWQTEYRVA